MRGGFASIAAGWAPGLAGIVLLGGVVWFLGPLLPSLEGWLARVAVIQVLLLVWAGAMLLLALRRRSRDAALISGVAGTDDATGEAAALGARLARAMQSMRRSRLGRGYLYEQPWYAIIGPPGAGKTTALFNAGLTFPLAGELGPGAVPGVGGTRLCDWWFTADAVLIDTAGRYTTQDSDAAADRAGWNTFLDLLKRTRPRQPLNGLIVAIALNELVIAPADRLDAHARAVRARLDEVQGRFDIRLPVYVLFTKADLIAGFSEFFGDLDAAGRDQVWGATFPLDAAPDAVGDNFAREFGQLLEVLNDRLFARLLGERGVERRALIAGFPTQAASLQQPLQAFLQQAFGVGNAGLAPLLRGAYFVSGTQEGTPLDRLFISMSRAFGIGRPRAQMLRPEQGRSYFLGRLLREVVFGEAMLVSEPASVVRRRFALRAAGFAAIGLVVLAAGGMLLHTRLAGQRQIDAVAAALGGYGRTAGALALDPVSDADLALLVPLLDQARLLPYGVDDPGAKEGPAVPLGLGQGRKLGAGARAVYRNGLHYALLPRLIWRLEAQMRGALNRPDFLYEATKVYLMLGGAGPLDRNLVQEWMALDWDAAYAGASELALRQALKRHLEALLAEPLAQVALDGELVAAARASFGRVSLAQRVYSIIRPSAAARALPPWRPIDALGVAGGSVFVRSSGKPLSDGIPGFYTVDGFHKALLPSLAGAAREIAAENWVLGTRTELDPNGEEMRALQSNVIRLYEDAYAAQWNAMLADIDIVPLRSLTQAARDLYILASPQSPMLALLGSIAHELRLSAPPRGAQPPAAAPAIGLAGTRLQSLMKVVVATATALPGQEIDERYAALLALVGEGAGAPVEQVLKVVADLQQQLAKLAAAPINASAPVLPAGNDPAIALKAEAQRQPQPMARWLEAMASAGTALRGGGSRQVAAVYNATGGPGSACAAATGGRYPFNPAATEMLGLDEFSRLFAPGAMFDSFFNTQLKPYVDTSARPWKPQAMAAAAAPVAAADLAQFQRASAIRDLFFANLAVKPSIEFEITPVGVDPATRQAMLDIYGTPVIYAGKATHPTQITWPGPNGATTVQLYFDPPAAGQMADSGPWSLFRLFARGTMQPGKTPDRATLTLRIGERRAVFDLRFGGAQNPFVPGFLQEFRCPIVP